MRRFLLARLGWAVPVVLAILVVNFLIIHIVPGDPIQALIGDFPAPPGYADQIRHEFGLDQPVSTQLGLYLLKLAKGQLGFSFANRQPVLGLILQRAQFTLLLMLPALAAAAILGIVMALAAAPRAGSLYDLGVTALSLVGFSLPIFWLGQLLDRSFSRSSFTCLPAQGMFSLRERLSGWP